MKPAVVKTKEQHAEYLARIEELAMSDPAPNTSAGAELELLALLVESYEEKHFQFDLPDPVEAVKFRMMEQDLKQVDLVPYFGSRSRVSEFLSRQRPLTVAMIREISEGLGIPSDVLLQESVAPETTKPASDLEWNWLDFPVKEMLSRGWIALSSKKATPEETTTAVQRFIEQALGGAQAGVLTRRTFKGDAFTWQSVYSLTAWQARVLQKAAARDQWSSTKFCIEDMNEDFLRGLVSLSQFDDGPKRAVDKLAGIGVSVVVEEHLAKTKLDGAAMVASNGNPVIGLTLRFDRVDNFWFTLMHEVVHVWKHLSNPGEVFLDRLMDKESTEAVEKEANRLARDLLISRAAWKSANVRQFPTKAGIVAFAQEQHVHPAIVAGRIQKEQENYAVFSDLVGRGMVKHLFA
ncbi:ImmA/IrrE family metallo-endopeptidase [Variovorax sp. YR752]|uniref:ImmA/IrrE family metallo-endopeptidase n=1 Tax=Variovorax sp. YR752 TaxID=1884383 RepID=UPI0015C72F5B|nr:ImmA/IrrE family metallo-endopeptidase [Variovorax sp. YR752]